VVLVSLLILLAAFKQIPQTVFAKYFDDKAYVFLCLSDAVNEVSSSAPFQNSSIQVSLTAGTDTSVTFNTYLKNGTLVFSGEGSQNNDDSQSSESDSEQRALSNTFYQNCSVEKNGTKSFYMKNATNHLINTTNYQITLNKDALTALVNLITYNHKELQSKVEAYVDTFDADPVVHAYLDKNGRVISMDLSDTIKEEQVYAELSFLNEESYLSDITVNIINLNGNNFSGSDATETSDGVTTHTVSGVLMSSAIKAAELKIVTTLEQGNITSNIKFKVFGHSHTIKATGTYDSDKMELSLPLSRDDQNPMNLTLVYVTNDSQSTTRETSKTLTDALGLEKMDQLLALAKDYLGY